MENEEGTNKYEWDVPSDKELKHFEFVKVLDDLLLPYKPVGLEKDSDIQWTTNEIIQAIEMHYGAPQGDPGSIAIDGIKLVDELKKRGFIAVNTGGLQLQWLMKNSDR